MTDGLNTSQCSSGQSIISTSHFPLTAEIPHEKLFTDVHKFFISPINHQHYIAHISWYLGDLCNVAFIAPAAVLVIFNAALLPYSTTASSPTGLRHISSQA